MQNKRPEKKGGFPLGKIAGIAVILVIVGTMCNGAGSGEPEDDGKKERPLPTTTTWRKAETKQEAFERVKARLSAELAALGLDASNIVANAKAHPTRLRGKVPEHARSRWLVLSTNDEAVVARRYVEECRKAGLFDDRQDQIKRVCAITEKLVAAVPEIAAVPDIHIIRDDSVNACCLPDGTVFVNTGTLEAIDDDSLLAAILAHELGHAASRHGNEDVTQALVGAAGGVAFEEWTARVAPIFNSGEGVSLVRLAYGLGGDVGFHLPRSRLQESEADRLGVRYLARAGFDPESMVNLFLYFEKIAPSNPDLFSRLFSTHPMNPDRIGHVREVLDEPDLHEMPQDSWREKAKAKADEMDFSDVKTRNAISNAMSRLPKIPKVFHKKSQQSPADASDGCSERQENQDTER